MLRVFLLHIVCVSLIFSVSRIARKKFWMDFHDILSIDLYWYLTVDLDFGDEYDSLIYCFWFLPRDALLSAVYAVVVCLSVCVCVSVTLRYCIKTAKHRITQTTPHDSPMTLVYWCQISRRNSNGITPYGGDKCRWSRLKFVTFDEKRAITQKRYKIDI